MSQAWPRVLMRRLRRERRGVVGLLTALLLLPLIGLIGLAIDFGAWNQARTTVALAADGAAMNALKIASSAQLAGDANYAAEGIAAGRQWFAAEIGAKGYVTTLSNTVPTISISLLSGTTLTAKVTLSAYVPLMFGGLFGVPRYPLAVEADSSITTAPYLEFVFMLDNSSSMQIGATPADMAALASLSPCDPSNAFYGSTTNIATWSNGSDQGLGVYQCSGNGYIYDGTSPSCPVPAGSPLNFSQFVPIASTSAYAPPSNYTQSCAGALPKQANGLYPAAGAPCAFACHWTNATNADGTTQDLFGMARRNGVRLRFDLLKNATNTLLETMQADNVSLNSLTAGIYTFNIGVTQVYPTGCSPGAIGCEAGNDFSTAQNLVGMPPVLPAVADTGIQPVVGARTGNNDETAFPEAMNTLARTYLTSAGTGTAASSPRKVLMLITDGFQDDPFTGARKAMDPAYCTQFKNMGFTVYVIYTPYYPVLHTWYYANAVPIVEGSGTQSIAYNLQACSSGPGYYQSAADQASLNATMTVFLNAALRAAALFSK